MLISGFIIITYKFNTATLNKRTNLTCPEGFFINQHVMYLSPAIFLSDIFSSLLQEHKAKFESTWQSLRLPMFCTTTNPRLKFSLFQLVCQKIKILYRIKLNQDILTKLPRGKLLKTMHQLSINLLCSSNYQTTYSFCEIKHFVKQAKSL